VRPPATSMAFSDFVRLLREQGIKETFYLEYLALHQYLGTALAVRFCSGRAVCLDIFRCRRFCPGLAYLIPPESAAPHTDENRLATDRVEISCRRRRSQFPPTLSDRPSICPLVSFSALPLHSLHMLIWFPTGRIWCLCPLRLARASSSCSSPTSGLEKVCWPSVYPQ